MNCLKSLRQEIKVSEMNEYQQKALATAAVRQKNRAGKAWAGLELASEILETAALVIGTVTKSQFRPKGKHHDEFLHKLKDELGDCLWGIAVVAAMSDLNLADIASQNLSKVGAKHGELGATIPILGGARQILGELPKSEGGAKKAFTTCPRCGTGTAFKEGCVSCTAPDCGWSVCS